jgi:alpha-D-ribose 1-methylphosphonate 5-triphosphate diphosphatase
MVEEFVLKNAKIVTPSNVVEGSVHVRGGLIADIEEGSVYSAAAVDCEGDHLVPGLIDLHTDNLERHIRPRNSADWPALAGVMAHDNEMAIAGITTVLDALYAGGRTTEEYKDAIETTVAAIATATKANAFRSEHFLHLRAEVSREGTPEQVEAHYKNPIVRFISIMDHTPGQRQFVNGGGGMGLMIGGGQSWRSGPQEPAMPRLTPQERQEKYSIPNRARLIEMLNGHTVPLASHDDTTIEHIQQSHAEGIAVAEFPTTLEAAKAAREHGMKIIEGSPNLILGGSRSGNVAVSDLVSAGLLDVLASDYVPASLLYGVFLLSEKVAMPLPKAVALATSSPAHMVGLDDRGSLETGKRADLVRVGHAGGVPFARAVWRRGRRVA